MFADGVGRCYKPAAVVSSHDFLEQLRVAVVIPAYRAESTLRDVVAAVPATVESIVVVCDGGRDRTADVASEIARDDPRVLVVVHPVNRGVGAATRTGYLRALEIGADIVVKMDADGQMDPAYLPHLVLPIALGLADYTKGNRFLRLDALQRMPLVRLLGNSVLSFMSKLSSGYWQVLDPTNGFTAISRDALSALDLSRIEERYFFESSMLIELGMIRAVVSDVPLPSRYGDESSQLSVAHSALTFAGKHVRYGFRRLAFRYLLSDFSPASLLILASLPLIVFGVAFGVHHWIRSAIDGVPATAGTVMVAAFSTAAGMYCLVQALVYDMLRVPQRPLTLPRLRPMPIDVLAAPAAERAPRLTGSAH